MGTLRRSMVSARPLASASPTARRGPGRGKVVDSHLDDIPADRSGGKRDRIGFQHEQRVTDLDHRA
jgi:hypothetical protein